MIARPLVWAASLLAAWAAAAVAVTLVRSIGLIVPEGIAWLAGLLAGALVAAPAAAWSGALLRRDGTRARLWAVVTVVAAAAVLLVVPVSAGGAPPGTVPGPPPIVLALQSALVLALVAATAAQLLRRTGGAGKDVRTTAWLLAFALLIGLVAVMLAAMAGLAGS